MDKIHPDIREICKVKEPQYEYPEFGH
jgi:hypothetical protein